MSARAVAAGLLGGPMAVADPEVRKKLTQAGSSVGDFFKKLDPTVVGRADESGVRGAQGAVAAAGKEGQDILRQRMEQTKAPTVERVAGPQAGQIDTQFLEALRGQLGSGRQAIQGAGEAQAQAQTQAQEATGLLREAAMGTQPSAAQLQDRA